MKGTMKMIVAEYQEWKDGILVHEYQPFSREKALANGEYKAVERYDYCVERFQRLSAEERKRGLIYGGLEFDFSLEEVD